MEIVLVMLNNFQSYILDNIYQLQKTNNSEITVICDKKFKSKFENLKVKIVIIEDLISNYSNITNNNSNTFRNGFWYFTTFRFFAIFHYMKKNNCENIIHIENDVLIYKDLKLINFHDKNKILLTIDSQKRCIPGLMFLPTHNVLNLCLQHFKSNLNDMENWANCFYQFPNLIDSLPIFKTNKCSQIFSIITNKFEHYNCIFDAAAIGQFIGGIDPRNCKGNTEGFVNETCLINYSKYTIIWKKEKSGHEPFLQIDNEDIPIINLHIHSKNLKKYI
jgi:hypothetical protein